MRDKGRIFRRQALLLGLALWGLLAFSAVAECVVSTSGGSHDAAHGTASHAHGESAHIESEVIGPADHQCHHNVGHQHKNAADTIYASPRRVVDQADAPTELDVADWSAASALLLLGLRRRGPTSPVSRSSPSGRHILISECVART